MEKRTVPLLLSRHLEELFGKILKALAYEPQNPNCWMLIKSCLCLSTQERA